MTAAVTPSGPADAFPLAWVALPAAISALVATAIVLFDLNEAWFRDWNGTAGALLPPFLWAGITNLGSTLGAFALITPALAWRPRWIAATLLAAPAATLYTHALKALFAEPRPPAVLSLDEINVIGLPLRTDSFPSGHTITAFVLAGVLTFCATRDERRWLGWAALVAATAVAFSRIAVGAHWPLDIFAGAAGGWLCAAIGVRWSASWRFWEARRGVFVMAGLMMLAAVLFAFEDLGYPEGLWMQYGLVTWGLAGAVHAALRPTACRAGT